MAGSGQCALQFVSLAVCLLGFILPYGGAAAKAPATRFTPRIHYTPSCFIAPPPHDIAGAVYIEETHNYHVMVGCWSQGGWQHLVSRDLVHWAEVGSPTARGGSGGLVRDAHGHTMAYSNSVSAWLSHDLALESFTSLPPPFSHPGGGDPVMWRDERDGRAYAITANGRAQGGGGAPGHGLEDYFSSPALHGDRANWTQLPYPLLERRTLRLPRMRPFAQVHEFVTPDFFPIQNSTSAVFLTSTYGPGPNGTLYNFANYFLGPRPDPGAPFVPDESRNGAFDWSVFAPVVSSSVATTTGDRCDTKDKSGGRVSGAGGVGASSSSASSRRSLSHRRNLTMATGKGISQWACCPKTVAGPNGRRIMFNWMQNGGSSHQAADPTYPESVRNTNNTLALPRDLFVGPDGHLRQRFVPELAVLRSRLSYSAPPSGLPLPSGGPSLGNTLWIPAAAGRQLEIRAQFSVSAAARTALVSFGFALLADTTAAVVSAEHMAVDSTERTVVGFDTGAALVLLNRTLSGADMDADVRAGPWYGADNRSSGYECESVSGGVCHGPGNTTTTGASATEDLAGTPLNVSVTMYVDHSLVSLIADERTALTAWVHPQQPNSTGFGLWADGPGVTCTHLDVWQLSDATPPVRHPSSSQLLLKRWQVP